MDKILEWCEPMKQHSLVSLQIKLAYLWKLKKVAKAKAAAKRKKDKLKAKKKAEEEKKRLARLAKKEKRKKKKRKYKQLLLEAIKIIYYKEQDRRELEFNKLKKKSFGKKLEKDVDVPIDTVVWSIFPTTFKPVYEKNKEKKKKRDEKEAEKALKKKSSPSPAKKKEKKDDSESKVSTLTKALSVTSPKVGSPDSLDPAQLAALNRSSTIKNTDLAAG